MHPVHFPTATLEKGPWGLDAAMGAYQSIWKAGSGFVRAGEQEHLEGKEGAFSSRGTAGCPERPPQAQLAHRQQHCSSTSASLPPSALLPRAIALTSHPQLLCKLVVT